MMNRLRQTSGTGTIHVRSFAHRMGSARSLHADEKGNPGPEREAGAVPATVRYLQPECCEASVTVCATGRPMVEHDGVASFVVKRLDTNTCHRVASQETCPNGTLPKETSGKRGSCARRPAETACPARLSLMSGFYVLCTPSCFAPRRRERRIGHHCLRTAGSHRDGHAPRGVRLRNNRAR